MIIHYKVTHIWVQINQECYHGATMGMFVIYIYCEHTSGLILFLIPLHLVVVAMGTEIHSISSNRQILEEVVLISLLSLWLYKEEKDKMHRYLKTQQVVKKNIIP